MWTFDAESPETSMRVVRGLNFTWEPEEIAQDLKESHSTIAEVTIMITDHTTSIKIPADLFKIRVNATDAPNLEKVKYLLNQKVTWERPTKTEITQCYRCQRFGHISTSCRMKPRCVKCPDYHPMLCGTVSLDEGSRINTVLRLMWDIWTSCELRGMPDQENRSG